MPKYIDKERLKRHYAWWEEYRPEEKRTLDEIIDIQPEIEIVRCFACKYNDEGECRLLRERDPEAKDHRIYSNFFCAYGER